MNERISLASVSQEKILWKSLKSFEMRIVMIQQVVLEDFTPKNIFCSISKLRHENQRDGLHHNSKFLVGAARVSQDEKIN
jgi:hypothetical protein